MQYPSQEPAGQPYYPPSEVYMPEQPQAYPSQNVSPPPEIAVYAKRGQTIARLVVCVICFLIVVLIIPFFAIASALAGQPLGIGDLAPLFIVGVPAAVLIGWIIWSIFPLALAKKPLLLINQQGIVVGPMPMQSGFSIAWGEIEALFPSRYMYKYLCITPRNPDQYLAAHFHSFEQLIRRLNSRIGSPLYIPQMYLSTQVEEILRQLYYIYAKELSYYHVQVRS